MTNSDNPSPPNYAHTIVTDGQSQEYSIINCNLSEEDLYSTTHTQEEQMNHLEPHECNPGTEELNSNIQHKHQEQILQLQQAYKTQQLKIKQLEQALIAQNERYLKFMDAFKTLNTNLDTQN